MHLVRRPISLYISPKFHCYLYIWKYTIKKTYFLCKNSTSCEGKSFKNSNPDPFWRKEVDLVPDQHWNHCRSTKLRMVGKSIFPSSCWTYSWNLRQKPKYFFQFRKYFLQIWILGSGILDYWSRSRRSITYRSGSFLNIFVANDDICCQTDSKAFKIIKYWNNFIKFLLIFDIQQESGTGSGSVIQNWRILGSGSTTLQSISVSCHHTEKNF
jgi:hypothetical protein